MERITEVLEILSPQGQKTGMWQLTTRIGASKPHRLCTHVHHSYESAWNCMEAWAVAKKISRDSL